MTEVYAIEITDQDGETLARHDVREQSLPGADDLATYLADVLARVKGEIWASDWVTMTITRKDRPDLAPLAAASYEDEGC
jgi:hypothetical protein